MNTRLNRRSSCRRSPVAAGQEAWIPPLLTRGVPRGTKACCCAAIAQYAVYLAGSLATQDPPEILLCAHHLRASADRLSRSEVAVYDAAGRYVDMDCPQRPASANNVLAPTSK